MWKGTVRNSTTANAKKTLQVIAQNEYSRKPVTVWRILRAELNKPNGKHSPGITKRKNEKEKGTSTSFGEKSSRKANLPSHRIIHISFDRFGSLGSFVRSFLSLSHPKKEKQSKNTSHFCLCAFNNTQKHGV
jgi:hypothetical protein